MGFMCTLFLIEFSMQNYVRRCQRAIDFFEDKLKMPEYNTRKLTPIAKKVKAWLLKQLKKYQRKILKLLFLETNVVLDYSMQVVSATLTRSTIKL